MLEPDCPHTLWQQPMPFEISARGKASHSMRRTCFAIQTVLFAVFLKHLNQNCKPKNEWVRGVVSLNRLG